jgi:hypothetical protein
VSNPNANEELETTNIEHHVVMGEALGRLRDNPDFKLVIQEGYLKEKALASVSLLGVPQERNRRVEIMEDLIAGSNLQFYFAMIEQFYEGAKAPILSDDEQEALEADGEA